MPLIRGQILGFLVKNSLLYDIRNKPQYQDLASSLSRLSLKPQPGVLTSKLSFKASNLSLGTPVSSDPWSRDPQHEDPFKTKLQGFKP